MIFKKIKPGPRFPATAEGINIITSNNKDIEMHIEEYAIARTPGRHTGAGGVTSSTISLQQSLVRLDTSHHRMDLTRLHAPPVIVRTTLSPPPPPFAPPTRDD